MRTKYAITLFLIIISIVGCKKKSPSFSELVGDYATITGVKSQTTKATEKDPIIDSAVFVAKYTLEYAATDSIKLNKPTRGFGPDQRDTINGKLFFHTRDVVGVEYTWDGEIPILGGFVACANKDYVITGLITKDGRRLYPFGVGVDYLKYRDTIAYIPNKVIRAACKKIEVAFKAGDFIECKRLFDEAFVFIPTTGAKWRAMKAAGIE
ncbi:MAG: hypothetical protein RR277_00455 [Rikenellaceae bacterium]